MNPVPLWADVVVAVLLALSGVFVLVSAMGFLRLPDFFLRMHPPALAYTFGSWCVAGATVLYFSIIDGRPALYPLLIPVLLAITVPVTTVLLARVGLFRGRLAGADDIPPTLPVLEAPPTPPADEPPEPPPAIAP